MFADLMDAWGRHPDETVLDYGCGPGDDLVGFLLYSSAAKVIGIDVSPKALDLARHRLGLHGFHDSRVQLIRTSDTQRALPLATNSIDYINCGGVLHHVSEPTAILREFNRVLKPSGRARIMVYNRQSLWFHLYVAYMRMILDVAYIGLSVEQAFSHCTDGEDCPISVPYRAEDFLAMLAESGLKGHFLGGYLSTFEVDSWKRHGRDAVRDRRLAGEHKTFLAELEWDDRGLPRSHGKHAGIGGVYAVSKS